MGTKEENAQAEAAREDAHRFSKYLAELRKVRTLVGQASTAIVEAPPFIAIKESSMRAFVLKEVIPRLEEALALAKSATADSASAAPENAEPVIPSKSEG